MISTALFFFFQICLGYSRFFCGFSFRALRPFLVSHIQTTIVPLAFPGFFLGYLNQSPSYTSSTFDSACQYHSVPNNNQECVNLRKDKNSNYTIKNRKLSRDTIMRLLWPRALVHDTVLFIHLLSHLLIQHYLNRHM